MSAPPPGGNGTTTLMDCLGCDQALCSGAVTQQATSAVAPAAKEANATAIGRFEPVPGFVSYNLAIQYYPRFATANFDRGIVLYRVGDFDPFAAIAPLKPATELRRAKIATPAIATPVPRKPLAILPPAPPAPPERRMPITAALTP